MAIFKKPQQSFLEILHEPNSVIIASHEKPDGDCIASALALARYLKSLGREVLLYNPGPFARKEIREYKSKFSTTISKEWLDKKPLLVLVDCAELERVRIAEAPHAFSNILIVDHHSSSTIDSSQTYIVPGAPSCTLLIQHIIEQARPVTKQEAKFILLGFITDTGFFRHLDNNTAEIFEYIVRLMVHGFSLRELYYQLFGDIKHDHQQLASKIIQASVQYLRGDLIIAHRTLDDYTEGIGYFNGALVYGQLMMTRGVKVVVFITELQDGGFDVSLRSLTNVDVGAIAQSFGGGGHVAAAGFRWFQTRDSLEMQIIQQVKSQIVAGGGMRNPLPSTTL